MTDLTNKWGALALASAVLTAGHASADLFAFEEDTFVKDASDKSNIIFQSIESTYDDATQVFSWEATFEPDPGVTPEESLPTGFVLVVNDGPMPKGHVGELATIYFDAKTNPADPIVSAYAYNGASSATSHLYSIDPMFQDPSPAPDQIISSLNDASFVQEASLTDNPDGTRTLKMVIDATPINSHIPLQASYDLKNDQALAGWFGIGYDQGIGVWFHPFLVGSDYYASGAQEGYLLNGADGDGWNRARRDYGFYDKSDLSARLVPEPTSALLMLAGVSALAVRRRQA